MKRQYTKKQITEAIKHWEKQLQKMNENSSDDSSIIDESQDFSNASVLKLSCSTNTEYNETFYKD